MSIPKTTQIQNLCRRDYNRLVEAEVEVEVEDVGEEEVEKRDQERAGKQNVS